MTPKSTLSKEVAIPAAIHAILLALFVTIRKNKHELLNRSDSEFLHDYRVAIRRTRCLLSQFQDVFHQQPLRHFRSEFSWLFTVTGKVRDIDVQLAHLPDDKILVPVATDEDWDLLTAYLLAEQNQAYERMLNVLDSRRYQKLLTDWSIFLYTAKTIKHHYANRPIGDFAHQRIRLNHREILKQGRVMAVDTPDEIFHEMRKRCKQLRYLLEFFSELYHAKKFISLLNGLKKLQDNLGRHQDLCVQINLLQQSTPIKPSTWTALLEVLESQKQLQRIEFKALFHDFKSFQLPLLKN